MICFEFSINGRLLKTAGIPARAVLASMVTWACNGEERRELTAKLGGLDSNGAQGWHLEWVSQELKVGDAVSVRVVEREQADPPAKRRRGLTPPESLAQAKVSYRAAIKRYRKKQAELEVEIARLEGQLKTKPMRPRKGR